ncbi:MAG: DNA adenine methylase [Syntrophobacteraceae bacterium]
MSKPFLRWAGGKRWLARMLAPMIRERLNGGRYFEPFLGSGAMFFAVAPERAVLSDLNEELVVTFQQVAENPGTVIKQLKEIPASKESYYEIRSHSPSGQTDRAVRFVYLNRNCYGGIHRENRQGQFNVPFGGGTRNHLGIISDGTVEMAAEILSNAEVQILAADFESVMELANQGDIIYCDPTYRAVTRTQFDRYGKIIFGWQDQIRLAQAAAIAYERGALVIVSNTSSRDLAELYPKAVVFEIVRPKGIGPKKNEGIQAEYVLVMDPDEQSDDWADRLGALGLTDPSAG